jgi:hypothetical protein
MPPLFGIIGCNVFTQGMEAWAPLDEQLCKLVAWLGRTGYRHTLEVGLRPIEIGEDNLRHRETGLTRVLPGFRKKMFVAIADPFHDDQG